MSNLPFAIKKVVFSSLVAAILFVLMFFMLELDASFSHAQASFLGRPFGGRILTNYPCTCSFNTQMYIGPPRGGPVMLAPGAIIYSYYNLYPPAWSLGIADFYLPCLQYVLFGCAPGGSGGQRIRIIGTSGT